MSFNWFVVSIPVSVTVLNFVIDKEVWH